MSGKLLPLVLVLFVISMSAVFGCRSGENSKAEDERAIEALFEARRVAMENRRPADVIKLLSADYSDRMGGLKEAANMISTSLDGLERLELRLSNRRIEIRGDRAQVIQDYFMLATVGEETTPIKGSEKLIVAKEADGRWLIVGGLQD